MEISLFKDEIIYMYLSRLIHIPEICQLIIHKKNDVCAILATGGYSDASVVEL